MGWVCLASRRRRGCNPPPTINRGPKSRSLRSCGQTITPMENMQRHLRDMFEDVRRFLVGEGLGRLDVVQMNAKGDVTKEFDFLAEARIIEWCRQAIAEPVRILTEERGEVC